MQTIGNILLLIYSLVSFGCNLSPRRGSRMQPFFIYFITIFGGDDMTKVGVIMGSLSDWETMRHCCEILDTFGIAYEKKVVSAHRTPDEMFTYAKSAHERGLKVIVAGAGGAAHLPGMVASKTSLPVIGVPVKSSNLNGVDSLLSIVQMPGGVPVATVSIGKAGATNAGLLAAQILASSDESLFQNLQDYKGMLRNKVLTEMVLPE